MWCDKTNEKPTDQKNLKKEKKLKRNLLQSTIKIKYDCFCSSRLIEFWAKIGNIEEYFKIM